MEKRPKNHSYKHKQRSYGHNHVSTGVKNADVHLSFSGWEQAWSPVGSIRNHRTRPGVPMLGAQLLEWAPKPRHLEHCPKFMEVLLPSTKHKFIYKCVRNHCNFRRFSSVAQLCLTLQPHGLQHIRLPCPSPTLGACSNSCPSSR